MSSPDPTNLAVSSPSILKKLLGKWFGGTRRKQGASNPFETSVDRSARSDGSPSPSSNSPQRKPEKGPSPTSEKVSSASVQHTLLPDLMRVYAGFSLIDGVLQPEDVDSSLDLMRYDYPEAVYSELRRIYLESLREPQDLNQIAAELATLLRPEQKILLGVQLYMLISATQSQTNNRDQLITFYMFMTNLGIATQAIDFVYQLNTGELIQTGSETNENQPLETISIAHSKPSDLVLKNLSEGCRVTAFRYQNLILLKNTGTKPVVVRGRRLLTGSFCRIHEGQQLLLEDVVLNYQDLVFYFNAKRDLTATLLYISLKEHGAVEIEPQRSKNSDLLIRFGLEVRVEALRHTNAVLNQTILRKGTEVEASLEDTIQLDGRRELSIQELRTRARQLGGQFRLEASKSDYLVSNRADQLRAGDILLSDDAPDELLLRISCDYQDKSGVLEIITATRPISVQDKVVHRTCELQDGDIITVGEGRFLRCLFSERIIEEQRNVIHTLEVQDLSHRFNRREFALEGIHFTARRGEMICVMGPSGCGKSTLLRTLAGHLQPNRGTIKLNGLELYKNLATLKSSLSYIPHEDAFDPLLSVFENMDTAAAIRYPQLAHRDRIQRVDSKLVELGLFESRHRLAGTPETKNLSSGERKRLNAGLDMISPADIFLFDEPTSGLSSKDSEHVLEIIRSLASNKIILVSIHQPSPRLFNMFDKAILLDKGGKLVFFGRPKEMLQYFWKVYQQETGLPESEAAPNLSPDFIFDVLETPLRDIDGDVIYEINSKGHSVPARRFSPEFWRDLYQTHGFLADVDQIQSTKSDLSHRSHTHQPIKKNKIPLNSVGLKSEFTLWRASLRRSYLSKVRNKANLFTTLLEAPALALLIAMVLKYSEGGPYTFAAAFHIPTYLFLSLVVAMFLGLTNSADEIIRDRALLRRERNHHARLPYYLFGKFISLGFFSLIQCTIYLLIGNFILQIREMFLWHLLWMYLTSLTGVATGLFISAIVKDSKTASNLIPLILVPQIILGGALIKYEEMNQNLDFIYGIRRWIEPTQEEVQNADGEESELYLSPSRLQVPFICEFMPLRWSYESLILSQAKLNPVTSKQELYEKEIQRLAHELNSSEEDEIEHQEKLDQLRQAQHALAIISGIKGKDVDDLRHRIKQLGKEWKRGTFNPADFQVRGSVEGGVSGEEIYVNRKILDLVTKAELERTDYRRGDQQPNVFFGTEKSYFGRARNTLKINFLILCFFPAGAMIAVFVFLKRSLARVK